MRPVLFIAAVLVAVPLFAQDKPKPNTLTPKEIADGWIMLFDGETTFGWKIDGPAEVKDGVFVLGGGKATTATLTTNFGSYDVQAETQGPGKMVFKSAGTAGFSLTNNPTRLKLAVRAGDSGSGTNYTGETGADGVVDLAVKIDTDGPAPLRIEVPAGGTLRIMTMKLKPVDQKPLFNGKDLSGWKVFDGDAKKANSKFEVTKDGELKVTNGPGDLQSEKQFDNFVLQFECKTNGKGLNSGVFFRCIPGQYQNGYEAQVQNEFLTDDRTKPKDFGTGAIYRRVPARKVVSNDNEWFTMTLVADGNHFSTWVNGYPTVDWTDDRPANDNARQGFKAGKGPISIQGHDPTTDLLFRNLRIVELPARKKN